ncbi:MAG: hypothetical protein ACOYL6_08225 [Bacteriovoracaceae bacterium]
MNKRSLKKWKNEKGQAMVEYVMLIMILSFIFTGLFKKLQGYLLSNPDSSLNQAMKFATFDPNFKRFGVRR